MRTVLSNKRRHSGFRAGPSTVATRHRPARHGWGIKMSRSVPYLSRGWGISKSPINILGNAVMYVMGSIESPDVHLGVGKLVDIGVHQLILDTPVWWGICRLYNGGRFKYHAPFVERRRDGLCLRTGDFLRSQGWAIEEELWVVDGTDCSPCDDKVPDSH